MKSFAVLGLGRFGLSAAKTIARQDFELIAIDRDPAIVQSVSRILPNVVAADCTDENALGDLGIKNCDVAIVAIGNDFENSVLATSLLKSMGIKKIVAKALNERNAEILYKIGADQVVLPETEMGMRVARALTETDILDRIYISDKHSIIELPPLTKWLSKTIAQLDLRGKFGITILAIKRNDEIMVSPLPIEIIQEHDVCVLLGENTGFEKLKNS